MVVFRNSGYPFEGPYMKDSNMLLSILESPDSGNYQACTFQGSLLS